MDNSLKDRVFRAALLEVCGEGMGKETWSSLCFLHSIPERVREQTRSDVLKHLVKNGVISSKRPEEFAEQLRKPLGHSDLADQFLGLLSEAELVETREGVRRPSADDRRHARHLTVSEFPYPLREIEEEDGEEPPTEPVVRQRTEACREQSEEEFRPRHDSMISNASSGYCSQRHSSVASRCSLASIPSHYDAEQDQTVPETPEGEVEGELNRQDSFPRSASYNSSASSSMEEDLQYGLSSSLSSLSTLGSLPRGFTAVMEPPTSLTPAAERRKSERSPEVIVSSPTHSAVSKTDTMILRCRDIISDIDQRLGEKIYCSTGRHGLGIDFKMKFYPTNHEGTGCALYVKVKSHLEGKVIPPLDISVSVVETSESSVSRSLSLGEKRLAHEQWTSKGNNLVIQGQFTALFPRLLDHQRLRQVSSDFLALQVTMEYSTAHPGNPS